MALLQNNIIFRVGVLGNTDFSRGGCVGGVFCAGRVRELGRGAWLGLCGDTE